MSDAPTAVSTTKPVRLPPEKQFWQRYSPHHEFPWSTIISVAIYVVIGLLAWAIVKLAIDQSADNKSLPVGAIELGGGGGDPSGVEGSTLPGDTQITKQEALPVTNPTVSPPAPVGDEKPLAELVPDAAQFPDLQSEPGRAVEDPAALEAMKKFEKVSENAKASLAKALGPPSKGKRGSGTGGGTGTGTGIGDGPGDGKGKLSVRQERLARWDVTFKSLHAGDYRANLQTLKAIIAIPEPRGDYLVIRDLGKTAVEGRKETMAQLESLQRIFFWDQSRESVRMLTQELRLPFMPPYFIAFFPEEFENELLEKELRFRGKTEGEIDRTYFEVKRLPNGKCDVRVTDQKFKRT